jgi:hypothetical protein
VLSIIIGGPDDDTTDCGEWPLSAADLLAPQGGPLFPQPATKISTPVDGGRPTFDARYGVGRGKVCAIRPCRWGRLISSVWGKDRGVRQDGKAMASEGTILEWYGGTRGARHRWNGRAPAPGIYQVSWGMTFFRLANRHDLKYRCRYTPWNG